MACLMVDSILPCLSLITGLEGAVVEGQEGVERAVVEGQDGVERALVEGQEGVEGPRCRKGRSRGPRRCRGAKVLKGP